MCHQNVYNPKLTILSEADGAPTPPAIRLTLKAPIFLYKNHRDQRVLFNLKSSLMS